LVVNKNIADLVNLLGKSNPKYANEYFNAIVRAKTENNIFGTKNLPENPQTKKNN
jgi:hypothetical protein